VVRKGERKEVRGERGGPFTLREEDEVSRARFLDDDDERGRTAGVAAVDAEVGAGRKGGSVRGQVDDGACMKGRREGREERRSEGGGAKGAKEGGESGVR